MCRDLGDRPFGTSHIVLFTEHFFSQQITVASEDVLIQFISTKYNNM